MRKWTDVGFSSIYYILEKLEKKGLAKSMLAKGKDKKEYSITKMGLTVLIEKTRQRLGCVLLYYLHKINIAAQ